MRISVSVGAAGGLAHDEIAQALGISRNTLEKHFKEELSTAAFKRRLTWLQAMDKAARKGNVAAQKALLATRMLPHGPAHPETPAVTPEPAGPKLGKKDQAQVDAVSAGKGTEWGDLLPNSATPLQ
jgi:AcrR family transcriptional regulator